jgi:DNA-directed RNA polymerase subunit RPC12/RpoP
VSSQNVYQRRNTFTAPDCPGCRQRMIFVDKKKVMFTDGRVEVTYRCETCGTETMRIVKEI